MFSEPYYYEKLLPTLYPRPSICCLPLIMTVRVSYPCKKVRSTIRKEVGSQVVSSEHKVLYNSDPLENQSTLVYCHDLSLLFTESDLQAVVRLSVFNTFINSDVSGQRNIRRKCQDLPSSKFTILLFRRYY